MANASPLIDDLRAQFPHYHKNVEHLRYIDVYSVLKLFEVTDPAIAHAVKKLLVPGKRTAGKTREQDIREAVVSLNRALQMMAEDTALTANGESSFTCTTCRGKPCQHPGSCPLHPPSAPAMAPTPPRQG